MHLSASRSLLARRRCELSRLASKTRGALKGWLFAAGILAGLLFVGLAFALGCGGLMWLINSPWGNATEAQQERILHELVAHYEPLVEGVHRYEADHGWPPNTLDDLVPDYVTSLPSLTTNEVDQFSYAANFTTLRHVDGSRGGHVFWYVVGGQAPDERCTWPDEDRECAGHAHLLFLLNEQDAVHDWRVLRAADTSRDEQTRAAVHDVLKNLNKNQTVGQAWSEVQSQFGTPRGDGKFAAYWSMIAWLPEFYFDIDADHFGYDSNRMPLGNDSKFGGWKLTRN